MSRVERVETEVQAMSTEELAEFRSWFARFDAGGWGRQIEADIMAGKLDELAKRALEEH